MQRTRPMKLLRRRECREYPHKERGNNLMTLLFCSVYDPSRISIYSIRECLTRIGNCLFIFLPSRSRLSGPPSTRRTNHLNEQQRGSLDETGEIHSGVTISALLSSSSSSAYTSSCCSGAELMVLKFE